MARRPLIVSLLAGTVALLVFPHVEMHLPVREGLERGDPILIGRQRGVDLLLHVGDVAIPNHLLPLDGSSRQYRLDARRIFWDTFLISAPVPEVFRTTRGDVLVVPWTQLPTSVATVVNELDSATGRELQVWLGLKDCPSDWHFEKIGRFPVPPESIYGRACCVSSIYAVNLFDFVNDWGIGYKEALKGAISCSVKQVMEEAGERGEKTIAFPAIAGAEHVVERHMVLSYEDSFGAVIDGIARAEGHKPAKAVFVIWHATLGHPEFQSAVSGLRSALYQALPEWRGRLQGIVSVAIVASFLAGMLATKERFGDRGPRRALVAVLLGIVVIPVVLDSRYTQLIGQVFPVSPFPRAELALVACLSSLAGFGLMTVGAVEVNRWIQKLKKKSGSTRHGT